MEKMSLEMLQRCNEIENLEKQISDWQLIVDEKKKDIIDNFSKENGSVEYLDVENNKCLSLKLVETKGTIDYAKFVKDNCTEDEQLSLLETYRKETRTSLRYSFKDIKKVGK